MFTSTYLQKDEAVSASRAMRRCVFADVFRLLHQRELLLVWFVRIVDIFLSILKIVGIAQRHQAVIWIQQLAAQEYQQTLRVAYFSKLNFHSILTRFCMGYVYYP